MQDQCAVNPIDWRFFTAKIRKEAKIQTKTELVKTNH